MLPDMRHLKKVAIIGQLGLAGWAIGLTAAGWLNTRIVIHLGWYGPVHDAPFSNPLHYGPAGLLAGIGVGIGLLVPPSPRIGKLVALSVGGATALALAFYLAACLWTYAHYHTWMTSFGISYVGL
jgi:hypothetical protein